MRAALRFVLVCVVAGCGDSRWVPVHRLADELAQANGARETPTATVGDTTRYALASLGSFSLDPAGRRQAATVGADGTITVGIACPEELAGVRLVASVAGSEQGHLDEGHVAFSGDQIRHAEEFRCPARGEPEPRLTLGGLDPGALVLLSVTGYRPPPSEVDGPWVAIEPGWRLRLAVGVARPGTLAETAPSRFVVRAEDRAGESVTLLDETLDPARRKGDRGWRDRDLDLAQARRRLDPEVRFVFTTETVGTRAGLTFPAWGDPTLFAPRPSPAPEARRPSVLLVSLDTLRADRLSSYGFGAPTTPALDRLAEQGTLFEAAVTQANWTAPAHATMLTGTFPCVHGMVHANQVGVRRLPAGILPLAQLLRQQGYATAAFTEDAYVDAVALQRGFGVFRANARIVAGGVIDETLSDGERWLRANADQDFFLFLHTYQVHAPYEPPPRSAEQLPAYEQAAQALVRPPSAAAARDASLYTAEVRHTDAALGRFFALLDRLELSERTIVIVTSDHGEAFGEHANRHHGATLFEEELRVPLIWRAPGRVAPNRRVSALVGLADIAPTVLDLVGLPLPPWMQGESLSSFLAPGAIPPPPRPERVLPIERLVGTSGLRAPTWKAVTAARRRSIVFLLDRDPGEVIGLPESILRGKVAAARQRVDAQCRLGASLVGTAEEASPSATAPADPDLERKLRALGYLD